MKLSWLKEQKMIKKILVTGGTVFVSKFVATYFSAKNYDVYVLNRDNHQQVEGVTLIKGDRNKLGNLLNNYNFDIIFDVTAYNKQDIVDLLEGVSSVKDYILISSSAVYPETLSQPFSEEQEVGVNSIWGTYGSNKIAAEQYLLQQVPHAYILRPPYLYGPMQNIYREPFIFECALKKRPFYLPDDGKMLLQFFYVEDLCKLMEIIINEHPKNHIINVGNNEIISVDRFVELCYQVAGQELKKKYVTNHKNQRDYFCFHKYEYIIDVSKQNELLPKQKDLFLGLQESFVWYLEHKDDVIKKDYLKFIDYELLT